jgi:spore coat protein U-like protein
MAVPAGRLLLPLTVIAAVALGSRSADAACTFTATGVAFGAYDVFEAAPTDSTGTISYLCDSQEKNITITLTAGAGTFAERQMRNGADTLGYNAYRDAARLSIWGDGTSGSTTYFIKNAPNNRWTVLTIYGRITAGQDVRVGTYTDTLVATIEF